MSLRRPSISQSEPSSPPDARMAATSRWGSHSIGHSTPVEIESPGPSRWRYGKAARGACGSQLGISSLKNDFLSARLMVPSVPGSWLGPIVLLRIFAGGTHGEGKIVSLFEPSTEVIRKRCYGA